MPGRASRDIRSCLDFVFLPSPVCRVSLFLFLGLWPSFFSPMARTQMKRGAKDVKHSRSAATVALTGSYLRK
ncbi:hypothetical protein LY76DRAFT_147374 [Colletotrichum caudatum]|nr:hypothetical protein LY76DRAFT_147374 [Colletotrichum caudatum]